MVMISRPRTRLVSSLAFINALESEALYNSNAYMCKQNRNILMKQVDESNQREMSGHSLSKIDGMPVAIKANFNYPQFNPIPALADSRMLVNHESQFCATVVQNLINSGAIITGLTHMDEFGMGSYGVNTYNQTSVTQVGKDVPLIAGGSSSGSAVAVQSESCIVSIGTDTGGSVRVPAAFCGLYGFKPSYGMISRFGVVEYAGSLDTVGLMGSNMNSIFDVFEAISEGIDPKDSTHKTREELIAKSTLRSTPRVGYSEALDIDNIISDSAKRMHKRLAIEIATIDFSDFDLATLLSAYYCIAVAECSSNLSKYTGVIYGSNDAQNGTGDYFETICTNRSKYFGEEVRRRILVGNYVLSKNLNNDVLCYEKANTIRIDLIAAMDKVFSEVDFLVLPVTMSDPVEVEQLKVVNPLEEYMTDVFNVLANLTGVPSVVLPSCVIGGKPIQIMARYGNDVNLLEFCKHLSNWRE